MMIMAIISAVMLMVTILLQSSDMQTEPPPRANFCETVNQWVVTNMHYCLNEPSVLTRMLSFGDLQIFGMKNCGEIPSV